MLLRLGGKTLLLLLLLLWQRWLLLLLRLLAEVSRSFVAPRVLMEVGWCLGTGAAVSRVVVMMVLMLSGLLDVVMGVPQLSVLSYQVLHLSLEFVDTLALRLDQALLVLDDGRELLQVKNGFHWIIQKALHY